MLLADDAFTFLFVWEFMSLSSWALVMAHHREPANARAGYLYLVMACFGTLALLLAFGLLAGPNGGYDFAAIRAAQVTPGAAALVLALALAGAGSKAGLVPLHVWLPLAHPAAPSHVSALMSGVMTKVAVYGFIRIAFDLLGEPAWWWGGLVLALGGITAVLGVLYALMQHDLETTARLSHGREHRHHLHRSGTGAGVSDQSYVRECRAGADRRAVSHPQPFVVQESAVFGTGAVLTATGERDMERLGGLIHPMPWTALAFLIGAAAISALPPLNGFVSEWLTFQAILASPELPQWPLKFLVPAVWRAAGTVRRAGRHLLRQGFRHHLPGSATLARRRRGAGDRSLFTGRAVRSGGALPAGWHLARTGGGRPVAGGGHAQWRYRLTVQSSQPLVDAGAGGGCQKQLAKRLAGVAVHGVFRNRRSIHRFPLPWRSGSGIAAFPGITQGPSPPAALPNRSAGCSAAWCSRRGTGVHAATGRLTSGAD